MIIHLFNSALVSGPETLVIPAIPALTREYPGLGQFEIGFLSELRRGQEAQATVDYARSFGLRTFEVPVKGPLDLQAIRKLAQVLEEKKPVIVHAHDVKASTYLAMATLYLKSLRRSAVTWKMVSTHHGIHARSGFKVRAYELFYRWIALKEFDAVLCVCTSDRELIVGYGPFGLKRDRVRVHLNGVDRLEVTRETHAPRRVAIRAKWEKDLGVDLNGKFVLGVAARLASEKNHVLLLDALSCLKEPGWVCICFGVGPLERELREKSKRLGLESQVIWAGYRRDLTDEMPGFDCLVSLSRGEGLPINLLEAGWARTAVLAAAVDGVQDLLPLDCPDLLLSRLDPQPKTKQISQRIQRFIDDPSQLQSLRNALFVRVSTKFSGQIWRSCLSQIYQDIHKFIN